MTWLTAELPGTGGHYKVQPEDFQVEEIPLYPCSGDGEHLYLWVEKTGISTRELLKRVCKGLKIKDRDVGYAGLKDAQATTRQMLSVPLSCRKRLEELTLRDATILETNQHGNKLRLGHLAGNQFSIRLRNVHPDAEQRATEIFARLAEQGVPNRFGEQRYGALGNSADLGLSLLKKDYRGFCAELMGNPDKIRQPAWQAAATAFRENRLGESLDLLPVRMRDERHLLRELLAGKSHQQAVLSLPRNLLRLFLSACQSRFFDQLLEQRLPDLLTLRAGDIAYKHSNGACFRVDNPELEQPRATHFEISPTAPLYGFKIMAAEKQVGKMERELLSAKGLTPADWKLPGGLAMPGERRPLRVPIQNILIKSESNDCLKLDFSLPKGSYATSVLLEIIKQTPGKRIHSPIDSLRKNLLNRSNKKTF